ncbi:hypothetical protein NQ315_002752 [Exocentrus adspersus]|uniref:Uncharacterized protein n=1 Tax=Exocentrus adspersus TaxID=1586481 RepID=A0AAV8VKG1_9CUCU|nr:hypothetical protein NQ315_002752 [Exocentrus adspersus]
MRKLDAQRLHPYHIVPHQRLNACDFDSRLDFCNWLLNMVQEDHANYYSVFCGQMKLRVHFAVMGIPMFRFLAIQVVNLIKVLMIILYV